MLVVRHPVVSAILIPTLLVAIVGSFGLFGGIIAIVIGFTERPNWDTIILGGVSVILGIVLVSSPFLAASWLPILVGAIALIGGILAIIFSFRLKRA